MMRSFDQTHRVPRRSLVLVVMRSFDRTHRVPRRSLVLAAAALCAASACGGSGHSTRGLTSTIAPNTTGAGSPAHTAHAAVAVPSQRYEPALPVAIQEAAAASVRGRLYVVGGYDTARNSSAAVFVFNGSAWHDGPSLPIAVNHPGAAAIGGDVYVAGGFTSSGATNRVFVLARGAARWREIASMRRPRGALALLTVGGRLYAIGGRDSATQVAVPERYDPRTGMWSDLPAMPAPRNHVGGYVKGVVVCVAGGRTPDTSASVDCFNTATSTWHTPATLPTSTSGAAAAIVDGVTIVAGGEPSGETSVVGVVQELRARVWTTEPMLVPRHGTAFAVYRGRLWLCGGATVAGFQAVATCTSLYP